METLVAISIFTISILGMLSVLASSISNTSYAKQKITAEYLAQEGIEYVRNIRDNYVLYTSAMPALNWNAFKATSTLAQCTDDANNSCGFDDSVRPTSSISFFKCGTNSINCKLYLDNNGNYNNVNVAGSTDSGLTRKIWMKTIPSNPDEVEIFSEVDWNQGSNVDKAVFSEDLFNWTQ